MVKLEWRISVEFLGLDSILSYVPSGNQTASPTSKETEGVLKMIDVELDLMLPDAGVQTGIYAKFFHGLSNPTRLRIVETLLEGERSVSQLVQTLGATQSQVSNQLACLKWCGYVTSRQDGKYVLYRISDSRVRTLLQLAREIVADNAEHIQCCTRM